MSTHLRKRNLAAISLVCLGYVVLCVVAIELFVGLYREQLLAEAREDVRQELGAARSRLEAALFRNTYVADSLATVLTINPSLAKQNWEAMADKLFGRSLQIRSIGIAPGDVITQIYPMEGNEAALGLDFRSVPAQMRSVREARQRESVYIAGPVDLVQGGRGLIARFPIFTDYPANEVYWGSVSVVMHFDRLIAVSGLSVVGNARVALQREEFGEERVFYGTARVFEDPDITMTVHTPSGEWQLGAQYQIGEPARVRAAARWVRATGGSITALVLISGLLLMRVYRHNRKVALQDHLTRLPNRRMIMGELRRLMGKTTGNPRFTVVAVDLNRFKAVNDSLGHEAGDDLLKHVAHQLQLAVRSSDMVARLGGDEFLILLHRVTDEAAVERILHTIVDNVEGTPLNWHGHSIEPSISAGFAIYTGQQTTLKELLASADEKMYLAKRAKKAG